MSIRCSLLNPFFRSSMRASMNLFYSFPHQSCFSTTETPGVHPVTHPRCAERGSQTPPSISSVHLSACVPHRRITILHSGGDKPAGTPTCCASKSGPGWINGGRRGSGLSRCGMACPGSSHQKFYGLKDRSWCRFHKVHRPTLPTPAVFGRFFV